MAKISKEQLIARVELKYEKTRRLAEFYLAILRRYDGKSKSN